MISAKSISHFTEENRPTYDHTTTNDPDKNGYCVTIFPSAFSNMFTFNLKKKTTRIQTLVESRSHCWVLLFFVLLVFCFVLFFFLSFKVDPHFDVLGARARNSRYILWLRNWCHLQRRGKQEDANFKKNLVYQFCEWVMQKI